MAPRTATRIWLAGTAALLSCAALIPSVGAPLALASVFVAGIGSIVSGRLRSDVTVRALGHARRGSSNQEGAPTRRERRRAARLATSGR